MSYKTHAPAGSAKPRHAQDAVRATRPAGVPRFLQHAAPALRLNRPHDAHEQEADRAAAALPARAMAAGPQALPRAAAAPGARTAEAAGSAGQPLAHATRQAMEAHFGADLGAVRTHTGPEAAGMARALGAKAFTEGPHIFFGAGRAPGHDALTAHELAHVLQQGGGAAGGPAGPLSATAGGPVLQRDLNGSTPVGLGTFEVDMRKREGAVETPPTHSGLDGYIRFVPAQGAPDSNDITMVQIVKLTDLKKADVAPATLPAAQAQRGALGQPGLMTKDDAGRGVEGGFYTDVHHQPNVGLPGAAAGSPLSPNYNFQPAAPGTTGTVGKTEQPALYGGGIGGVVGQTRGFKRSDELADIRSAALYDTPGVADTSWNLDFAFESVARGNDTGVVYGSALWGFGLRAGRVVDERLDVVDNASATFDEALERHRDFYVHEPVTFYFAFDSAVLSPGEAGKIDAFLPYLTRNPTARLSLEGFADLVGGAGPYNAELSMRRADAVQAALLARGIAPAQIEGIVIGHGASASATPDAGTGDQGGDPAVGADQGREANRWANRRVLVRFTRPAPTPTPAPAPAGP
jgi:outer membrane protein OmpA-like peptidoglycan-associated protein